MGKAKINTENFCIQKLNQLTGYISVLTWNKVKLTPYHTPQIRNHPKQKRPCSLGFYVKAITVGDPETLNP